MGIISRSDHLQHRSHAYDCQCRSRLCLSSTPLSQVSMSSQHPCDDPVCCVRLLVLAITGDGSVPSTHQHPQFADAVPYRVFGVLGRPSISTIAQALQLGVTKLPSTPLCGKTGRSSPALLPFPGLSPAGSAPRAARSLYWKGPSHAVTGVTFRS